MPCPASKPVRPRRPALAAPPLSAGEPKRMPDFSIVVPSGWEVSTESERSLSLALRSSGTFVYIRVDAYFYAKDIYAYAEVVASSLGPGAKLERVGEGRCTISGEYRGTKEVVTVLDLVPGRFVAVMVSGEWVPEVDRIIASIKRR